MLEAVSTRTASSTVDTGLAHINAYVLDYTDGYADAVYGGDLNGNLAFRHQRDLGHLS